MRPFFSIVIPTFNRGKMLHECLQSIRRQSFTDFEVIVVDNASSDDTDKVVAACGIENIQYVRHRENIGGFQNLIFSSKQGVGEFLVIHQDDDFLHRDFLQRCYDCVRMDTEIVVYGAVAWAGNASGGFQMRLEPDMTGLGRVQYPLEDEPLVLDGKRMAARYMFSHFINHPTIALRRRSLEEIGGYCSYSDCYGDLVTIPRLMARGKVAYDPRPSGVGHIHPNQISATTKKNDRARWNENTFRLQVETLNQYVPGWPKLLAEEIKSVPLNKLFIQIGDAVGFKAPLSYLKVLWDKCDADYSSRLRLIRKLSSKIGIKNTLRLLWRITHRSGQI